MSVFLHFLIAASFVPVVTTYVFAQQVRLGTSSVAWPYHPNRPGAEAYTQGGAFVATTGSVTSMLFNPAGLAQLPGRLVATVETGWGSKTEYIPFFNIDIASGFQPVQFAGVALQPRQKFSVGAFYARPMHYDLEMEPIPVTTIDHPEGTGEFLEAAVEREQTSLGLVLAAALGKQIYLGAGMEWRQASVRDEFAQMAVEGKANAVRVAAGAIFQVKQWHMGVSAQTKYKASGDITSEDSAPLVRVDLPPDQYGDNSRLIVQAEKFPFYYEDPATIRFGLATPYAFDRLRFSADAEYKDFKNDVPIAHWQFYGGGSIKLAPNVHLGFGAFTFRKDYSAYIDGPESETFWTLGGVVELSQFRFSASFMDGDLFTDKFVGQQFVNFAVGFVIP